MRVSEATTTNKKVLSLNKIRGVDLSSAPLRVKETRASYMRNMICKDGANHKRNGFEEIADFYDADGKPMPINGIFPFVKDANKYKIVHAGTTLYKCSDDFSSKEVISLPSDIDIGNEKSQGFVNDGKLYIVANDNLLVYDGKTVALLFNSDNAYVPTTSLAITDTAHNSLIEPFESVNLFNTKRINKLTGARDGTIKKVDVDGEEVKIFALDNSNGVFYLDGNIDKSKEVKITANIFINGPYDNDNKNVLNLAANNEEGTVFSKISVKVVFNFNSGETEATGESSCFYGGRDIKIKKFVEPLNEDTEIILKAKIENDEKGRGVVTFTPALPSPLEGEDNITVEYHVAKDTPKIKMAQKTNVGLKGDMLVLATSDDVVYYSHLSQGYSYIPDNNYLKVDDTEGITALVPGKDFLGVCTKNQCAIVTFATSNDNDKIVEVPSLIARHTDIGCINNNVSACVDSDALILDKNGVYGIGAGGVYMRSSNINKELVGYSRDKLMDAIGIEHDGRYYLFVGDKVYIADARYKTYESNRLDVSYEYEWWVWDSCPCRVAIKENSQIILGREDGRIMKLSDGYSDKYYYELMESECTTNGEQFTFNGDLGIKTTDAIKIENAYKNVGMGLFQKVTDEQGTITFTDEEFLEIVQLLVEKQIIKMATANGGSTKEAEIQTIDELSNSVTVKGDFTAASIRNFKVYIYIFIKAEYFAPVERPGYENYTLFDSWGKASYFIDYDEMKATLIREYPVECELHSAVMNLGNDTHKKTIHKIVFVPSIETRGKVHIGCETDKHIARQSQIVGGELDFGNLNFNNFTFDTAFYRRFEKRMHERNVEFVKFKFSSAENGDMCIENFSCIYSINRR